jgi:hypothetical protein
VRARCSIEDLALLRGLRLRRVDHRLDTSTTTGEFMPTKTLQIPTTDGQADAFAAFPDRGERRPGVLLYTDAFGVRPVLEEMARELAEHGYYVLVPNLYYRHGPAPVIKLPSPTRPTACTLTHIKIIQPCRRHQPLWSVHLGPVQPSGPTIT